MKVILTTNIKKIGKVGDQVSVKDGFAREQEKNTCDNG